MVGVECSPAEVMASDQDPLEWNQKKRTMIINLGLTDHSETGETPTPTRFIRNCEEVGLFQDLQHVNPFDEEFKKAIKNSNSLSVTLQVPAQSSDESLHTPQICTHFQANSENNNVEFGSVNSLTDGNSLVIVEAEPSNNKAPAIKSTKIRLKRVREEPTGIKLVPIEKLLNGNQGDEIGPKKSITKAVGATSKGTMEVQRQREANKAAQNRCRKRKQRQFEEIMLENARLRAENAELEKEIQQIQNIIRGEILAEEAKRSTIDEVREKSRVGTETSEKPSQGHPSDSKKRRRFKASAANTRKSLAPIAPKRVLPLVARVNSPACSTVFNTLKTVVVFPKPVQPGNSAIPK